MQTGAPSEDIVSRALALIRPCLHQGLAPNEALWAEQIYRDHVLPLRLAESADTNDEVTRRRVASVASDIVRLFTGLSADEKIQTLKRIELAQQAAVFSAKALSLAMLRAANPEKKSLANEAIPLFSQLEAFGQEIQERCRGNILVRNEVSEALLDAAYAVEPNEFLSFRLARLLGARSRNSKTPASAMDQRPD